MTSAKSTGRPLPAPISTHDDSGSDRGRAGSGAAAVQTVGAQPVVGRRYLVHAHLGGRLYLAVILDAYSRKVVGWALADHLRTELATTALQMALTSRRPSPGLIHHSDRGSQYTSSTYAEILAERRLRQSIGRPGTCWDSKNDCRWQALTDLTRAGIDHGVLALTCRSDADLPPSSICRAVT
jgi:transposase InsO family protein